MELKQLEELLDKGAVLGSPRSQKKSASNLQGWSPSLIPASAKSLDDDMDTLSLGVAALEGGTPSDKQNKTKSGDKATSGKEMNAAGGGAGVAGKGKMKKSQMSAEEKEERKRQAKAYLEANGPSTVRPARQQQQQKPPHQPVRLASQGSASEMMSESSATPRSQQTPKSGGGVGSQAAANADGAMMEREVSAGGGAREKGSGGKAANAQSSGRLLQLFSHLADHRKGREVASSIKAGPSDVHPAVVVLGQRYSVGDIKGANNRAVSLLTVLRQVVCDYQTPPDKMLSWDLDKRLRQQVQFLTDCRPHCTSMGNAIKFLRYTISKVKPEMSEEDAKAHICDEIDMFLAERITLAGASIANLGTQKIRDGDTILTFGSSSLVLQILSLAKDQKKDFRVVVVDSRPSLEGRSMVKSLSSIGVPCTYVLITAMPYVLREVTKVFLGASALMANGAVLSRVGTAGVAMMARSHSLPVLFCCETYKFCERVQLDSVVNNELGHPEELTPPGGAPSDPASEPALLKRLNLRYDLTPIKYVSLVITEVGIIPPTSGPALMREMIKNRKEDGA